MKTTILLVFAFCAVYTTRAQTAEDSVKTAVNNLFTAMKAADSVGIINAFAKGAILQSINEKEGSTTVADEKVIDFAHAIAGMQKNDADERIRFEVLEIDGPLAIVWTPYQFYYKGNFSHCGVDSYQLVRVKGMWKIQYLIDTRRKGGCL